MKTTTILFFLFLWTNCLSQNNEFYRSQNGLIYSDSTIQKLKFIVDSLNLKFKVCELNRPYFSKFQSKAHFISLQKKEVIEAKRDIDANISFSDFEKKYIKAKIDKDLLVIKAKYKNYEGKDEIEFSSVSLNDDDGHELSFENNLESYHQPLKGKWIYQYDKKSTYSDESIEAFYFIEDFSQNPLPDTYAKMIQYSDCMVDTTTQIFYEKNDDESEIMTENSSKVESFLNFVNISTGNPEYQKINKHEKIELFYRKLQIWDSLRILKIDSLKNVNSKFDSLFNEAILEVLNNKNGNTNDEFEEYVGRYYSKKTELELKRNRRVIGSCSQDNSPRVHALNIAKLSAETINWEIFLRSHLDIMNDRFERVSDGNYAWANRKTYIRELEILDINVLDLILGISLRIENPSNNHYYGHIGRLGRALSETANSEQIETKMLEMISNKTLDDYNRIVIYYLYKNYNYHLEGKEKKEIVREKLKDAIKTLPEYLKVKMPVEK
ncbi:MAG: hypothetical protein ACRCVT_02980 [Leadbetterella sp.]